jgi:hypothetical protein
MYSFASYKLDKELINRIYRGKLSEQSFVKGRNPNE